MLKKSPLNFKSISLLILLVGISFQLNAQQNPPPPPINPNDPALPIDGGLTALLVAGGALGYKKYKEHKDIQ